MGGALSRLHLIGARSGKLRRTLVSTNDVLIVDPQWMAGSAVDPRALRVEARIVGAAAD